MKDLVQCVKNDGDKLLEVKLNPRNSTKFGSEVKQMDANGTFMKLIKTVFTEFIWNDVLYSLQCFKQIEHLYFIAYKYAQSHLTATNAEHLTWCISHNLNVAPVSRFIMTCRHPCKRHQTCRSRHVAHSESTMISFVFTMVYGEIVALVSAR